MIKTKIEYISKKYKGILHIYDPIYRCNIHVLVSDKDKLIRETFIHFFNEESKDSYDKDGSYTVGFTDGKETHLIWLRYPLIEYLCHEAMHLTTYILGSKGLSLSNETGEAYAYYFQFIIKEIKGHFRFK